MPRVLDYPTTLSTLQGQGLRSLYYNSGAFGFPAGTLGLGYVGWMGPNDPTLRPHMLPLASPVPPPYPPTLARLASRAWSTFLPPGPAWVMPMSHWAYELDFGSHDWMPDALSEIGLDPAPLAECSTGNAVEFAATERSQFEQLLTRLLEHLRMSDFMLAFPGHPVLCTVHHHQQLWWQSPNTDLLATLRAMAQA